MSAQTRNWPRAMVSDPLTAAALLILTTLVLLAAAAPWISPVDPTFVDATARLRPPSAEHWLGTDRVGRDILSRALHGARISLSVGALVTVVALSIGVTLGLLAGYVRMLDGIIMRVMDGLMAIPSVLLGVAALMAFGSTPQALVLAITLPTLPEIARLSRSLALTIRTEPFIEAAVMAGTRTPMLLWRHILPNAAAPLIVLASYVCASAIIVEAVLSFLGIGTPSEQASWGNMIAEGRSSFQRAPWVVFVPSILLALTVLSINLIGDRLRDVTDPLRLGGR
ncbi:ABC transporter permease [Paracoccus aminophilus]|uniref:Peptide/nickel transport system, permease protein n=1 Tax=Paracoccus aminophilus JCM 7686 TaxID=1367847 RepID=S5XUE8_PARAH|nr:ABC transporter permease [Paracoccus aminophilus]AGT08832.1 peptide/nickel transport system, permease protein [Paracoccus aminophilus JCM 7686]